MMPLMETIRAYLGWCPVRGSMRADLPVRPDVRTTAAPDGRDGIPRIEPGWWNRYHNQLLVAAVAVSAAVAAISILVEDASGFPVVWTGLAIGAGSALGLLLSYRERYARVAAGEFIGARRTRRQRIVRDLSLPVASIILVVCMAYFVLGGMFGQILGFMLGVSLICWASYGVTTLWERQHRTTLIAEKGSMYVLGTAMRGERGEVSVWR